MKPDEFDILPVSAEEYSECLKARDADVFLTPAFNRLNAAKADTVDYLLFLRDGKPVGGIIGGMKNHTFQVPFSAPYGGFLSNGHRSFPTIEKVAGALMRRSIGGRLSMEFTFPAPVIRDSVTRDNIMLASALQGLGAKVEYLDINYHIDLKAPVRFSADIKRRSALVAGKGARFRHDDFNATAFTDVYDVISANHRAMGYPMRMSSEDYISTSRIVDIHLFSVLKDDSVIAAAICYVTRPGVMQLISWGDLPATRGEHGYMSFLATRMTDWIIENLPGISVLDLGPSSSKGIPSAGLCDFKSNMGAIPTLKPSVVFNPLKL